MPAEKRPAAEAAQITKLAERPFGEERRRSALTPHAFGAVVKLTCWTLLPAAQSWRDIAIAKFELRQVNLLPTNVNERLRAANAPTAQPINKASRSGVSGREQKLPDEAWKLSSCST